MDILVVVAIGIVAGQVASLIFGGYSLGGIGNAIAGLSGSLIAGKYVATIFGVSTYIGMLITGILGGILILAIFSFAESLFGSKKSGGMF